MESKVCCQPAPKDWTKICEEMYQFVKEYYEAIEYEMKAETSPLRYIEMKAILGALQSIIDRFYDFMR